MCALQRYVQVRNEYSNDCSTAVCILLYSRFVPERTMAGCGLDSLGDWDYICPTSPHEYSSTPRTDAVEP